MNRTSRILAPGFLVACLILQPSFTAFVGQEAEKNVSHYAIPPTDEGLPGQGPIRRYPWFQRLWEQRRADWANQVQQDQNAVVFLGDSITQGWGKQLDEMFPGMKSANRGISGDTTRGVLIRLQADVLSLHPSAVVLLIGTNDLEEQAEPEVIAGNLKLILDRLREFDAEMPIILNKVFPSHESKKRPSDQIKRINELYTDLAKQRSQVTVLETWHLFADSSGNASRDLFPDLLHPNPKGYTVWAAALRPILATMGFLETDLKPADLEPGFVSLFNGMDLTGWGYRPSSKADIDTRNNWHARDKNAPPWPIITEAIDFNSQSESTDGRYKAVHGKLVVTTPVEGRKIQQIWTVNDFNRDFILALQFRASPYADSGVFIRGRQLQCRDYKLAGPYKDLHLYRPQDWNDLVIRVKGTTATATCNGEILETQYEVPEEGPIGLEGDRGQMEFRNIRVKELSVE